MNLICRIIRRIFHKHRWHGHRRMPSPTNKYTIIEQRCISQGCKAKRTVYG